MGLGLFRPPIAVAWYEALLIFARTNPLILVNSDFSTELRVAKRVRPLLAIVVAASRATLLLALAFLQVWGIGGVTGAFGVGQALPRPCQAERSALGRTPRVPRVAWAVED